MEQLTSITRVGWLVVMAIMLSACARQPLPYPRALLGPGLEQMKLQSAAHWDLMAKNESQHITSALPASASVYVAGDVDEPSPGERSSFDRTYHQLLLSSLVTEGATVMLDERAATHQVEYDVEVVEHHGRNGQRSLPGTFSAAWLVAKFVGNVSEWGSPGPEYGLLPLAAGADAWNMLSPYTSEEMTEVVITTRVHDSSSFTMADSRVYYFHPEDMRHYRETGRSFPVVGVSDGVDGL